VLEGQIVMQLKGQPAVTLKAGQTFYERPTWCCRRGPGNQLAPSGGHRLTP
jgi:hypothetical protein